MSTDKRTEQKMRQYLLGELPEDRRLELEAEFFRDTETFEMLEAREDELMQDFVAGDLPPKEMEVLKRRWAGHGRMQASLSFARELRSRAKSAPVELPHSGWFAGVLRFKIWLVPAFAALTVLAIFLGVRSIGRNPDSNRQAQVNPNKHEVPQVAKSSAVFAIVLTPQLSRGGSAGASYDVPKDAKQIELIAQFSPKGGEYSAYSADLKTPEGTRIWNGDLQVASEGNGKMRAAIVVDCNTVPRSDLILTILGRNRDGHTTDVEDFSFRLE